MPELDLIEEPDKITHNVSLDDEFVEELNLNVFKFDPSFREKEAQWDEIKKEILGEYFTNLNQVQEEADDEQVVPGTMVIDRQNVSPLVLLLNIL